MPQLLIDASPVLLRLPRPPPCCAETVRTAGAVALEQKAAELQAAHERKLAESVANALAGSEAGNELIAARETIEKLSQELAAAQRLKDLADEQVRGAHGSQTAVKGSVRHHPPHLSQPPTSSHRSSGSSRAIVAHGSGSVPLRRRSL